MATILIVDDSDALRLLFRCVLSGYGYSVLEASDGIEAMQLMERKQPDLVLMDLNMPGLDGLTTLGMIKRHPVYKRTKVVMTTADIEDGMLDKMLATGCDWFLQKPFTVEQLRDCVAGLLSCQEVTDGRL